MSFNRSETRKVEEIKLITIDEACEKAGKLITSLNVGMQYFSIGESPAYPDKFKIIIMSPNGELNQDNQASVKECIFAAAILYDSIEAKLRKHG